MGLQNRRDPLKVDTVTLQQATDQYVAVSRDGTIAAAGSDAFGIAMESGDVGDPVPVTRIGFCPVIVILSADNAAEKTPLVVGANGKLQGLAASGGAVEAVVAISEEATSADGKQTGAWVDCVSYGRSVTAPA